MIVFRIVHKAFSQSLVGSGHPGRWNKAGQKVIYAAESIALAFLESMIRRQGVGFNEDFKIMFLEIPQDLSITTIEPASLTPGWDDIRNHSVSQERSSSWYASLETPVLKVPSVVLPHSFNFVINTGHKDFNKIKIIDLTPLVPDPRIETILSSRH
jgi:RES domain-containing protein